MMALLYMKSVRNIFTSLQRHKLHPLLHSNGVGFLFSLDSFWTVGLSYQASLPILPVTLFCEIKIRSLIQCSEPNEISFMVLRPLLRNRILCSLFLFQKLTDSWRRVGPSTWALVQLSWVLCPIPPWTVMSLNTFSNMYLQTYSVKLDLHLSAKKKKEIR